MKTFKLILPAFIFSLFVTGCNLNSEKPKSNEFKDENELYRNETTSKLKDFSGNYADDNYDKRNEGFDWVAVIVNNISEDEISISVRSRADAKRPTCLFDTKAKILNDSTYESYIEGKRIYYTFSDTVISISAEKKEDEKVLNFYCMGGATFAGDYYKINGPLDKFQIDKTIFSKVMRIGDLGFRITTSPLRYKEELIIYPFGESISKDQTVKLTIDGSVTDAEAEDLNNDGYPEILVYTQSGENKAGNVLGCSMNDSKTMSLFYFPLTSENQRINKGYNGHDEFSIVETTLSQRFLIFENGSETGKIRQIDYELVNGENGRVFEVRNVTEFDKK